MTIGNCITSIEDYTFLGCTGLTSIEIPNSVISIGNDAFRGCSGLESITIPNNITNIGKYAFYGCSGLTSIIISNSVTSIEDYVFYGCSGLTSIVIPNIVTSIGNYAFYGCSGLTSIKFPNSITNIGGEAFRGCSNLTSIVFPNNVTSIGNYAFYGCSSLTNVTSKATTAPTIGHEVFTNIASTATLNYPVGSDYSNWTRYFASKNEFIQLCYKVISESDKTAEIVASAAKYTGNIVIPSIIDEYSITRIADRAFSKCTSLSSIEVPNSVTSIGSCAFEGCTNLKQVHISDIAAWCNIDFCDNHSNPLFYAHNLYLNRKSVKDLIIPLGVTEIKDYAFYSFTGLTSIEIPNCVTRIGDYAFYDCTGVIDITIPNGVKAIGNDAFKACSNIETLYISSTIESIGEHAFTACNNIFEVRIGAKKAVAASQNIFSNDVYNNAYLYVPIGRKDFYAKTSPWSNFLIKEMDFTGIEQLKEEPKVDTGQNTSIKTAYDVLGRKVKDPTNGIYIIDGKKVFIK